MGHLKSIKMEKNVLVERKYLQALQLFQHSHKLWVAVFGEKHLETVKIIMIIAVVVVIVILYYYYINMINGVLNLLITTGQGGNDDRHTPPPPPRSPSSHGMVPQGPFSNLLFFFEKNEGH